MSEAKSAEINPVKESIKLYAKQRRLPTFPNYEQGETTLPRRRLRQVLCELMKVEVFAAAGSRPEAPDQKARFRMRP